MIPLTRGTQSSQIHRDSKQNSGCQGLKRKEWGDGVSWVQSSVENEKVLEMDGGNDCTMIVQDLMSLN